MPLVFLTRMAAAELPVVISCTCDMKLLQECVSNNAIAEYFQGGSFAAAEYSGPAIDTAM
ncbi:MAG: hypothetical protein JWP29_5535 [Rhodoferax sp.]|nr:hypothetical protein [Rhodoferax sp.]